MTPETTLRAAAWPLVAGTERRRLGRALLGFGLAGLVLLVLAAILVVGALGAVGRAAGTIDDQRVRLVAMLEPAEAALDRAATSAANAGTSLGSSAVAARDAAQLTTQLADAMDGMAAAAQVAVFGVQPFAALSGELSGVATRSRTLAADLGTTAAALDANVADSQATAADLRTLADELGRLRAELDGADAGTTDPTGTSLGSTVDLARVVLLGLLLWLAAPALAATWLGWRWRNG